MARSQSLRSILILLAVSLFIVACGGGGGSSDLTPNNFSFSAEDLVDREVPVESGTITVSGIDKAVTISITGGEYRINGGTYTSSTGTVSQGQTVEIRLTSSDEFETEATSTVTIGGVRGSFTATTLAQDIEPVVFAIDPLIEQEAEELITFASFTVSGITGDVSISLDTEASDLEAAYSINSAEDSAFVATAGSVSDGDTVIVRVRAGTGFSAMTTASIIIGSVEGSFSAVTVASVVAPSNFSIGTKVDQLIDSTVTSEPYTVTGINDVADISVPEGTSYSINSESVFVSGPGTVVDGDVVQVRIDVGGEYGNETTTTVTIGGITTDFSVTTAVRDILPNPFVIPPEINQVADDVVTSEFFIVEGINDAIAISIAGAGASYSINSVEIADFGTENSTVLVGDAVRVRLSAASTSFGVAKATLTLGADAQRAIFSVRTALTFESAEGQAPETTSIQSPTVVTITDFDTPQVISIEGGMFSVDGGEFQSSDGTVESGQELRVRADASDALNDDVDTIVTIDPEGVGFSGTYTVNTFADTTAPTASIQFPPRVSLTEGEYVTVRVIVSDDYSEVTRLQINEQNVEFDSETETWQVRVDLDLGENTLTLRVEDAVGNPDDMADQVVITRGDIDVMFPNSDVPFLYEGLREIELNLARNRLLVTDSDNDFSVNSKLIAIDMNTGVRSALSDNSPPNDVVPMVAVSGLAVDESAGEVYLSSEEEGNGELWRVNLDSGVRELISSNDGVVDFGGDSVPSMELDSAAGRLLIADFDNGRIVEVQLSGGERGVLFNRPIEFGSVGAGGFFGLHLDNNTNVLYVTDGVEGVFSLDLNLETPTAEVLPHASNVGGVGGIDIDGVLNRILFMDALNKSVFSVDMSTGERTLISGPSMPNADNSFGVAGSLAFNENTGVAYVLNLDISEDSSAVIAVDVISGERVFFSKSFAP